MRRLLSLAAVVIVVGSIGFIQWYRWDSGSNHGYEFGYFGAFNRVSNALVSLGGVTITNSWANCDVSMEEFGFTLTNKVGASLEIAVGEQDSIRSLSGQKLADAMRERIGAAGRNAEH